MVSNGLDSIPPFKYLTLSIQTLLRAEDRDVQERSAPQSACKGILTSEPESTFFTKKSLL